MLVRGDVDLVGCRLGPALSTRLHLLESMECRDIVLMHLVVGQCDEISGNSVDFTSDRVRT